MKADTLATPTISRVLPDGTLIEAVYNAETESTALAICTLGGAVTVDVQFDLPTGERLIPYSAANNLIASGCVLLPSDVGEFPGKKTLLGELRAYIHRYVDLPPLYEEMAAYYALLSWVSDAFNEVPYLRFQGAFGTGKTRALLAIGSVCYKPFFASGASTVSPIFHVLDSIGGTLVLDEADLRFSDATADLTKILNNGNSKGLPVLRTMTNRHRELNPQAFKVFGPKLIAMRERFEDEALESRFLTTTTGGRPLRRDIAISLPDAMKAEALALRNRLLAWRFETHHEVAIDPGRMIEGLSPRGNQMALPLLSLIDDENLRAGIGEMLLEAEAQRADVRAAAPDATMARVLIALKGTGTRSSLALADIMEAYNELGRERGAPPLSAKSAGWLVRKLGFEPRKSRGVYVIPGDQMGRIDALAVRYDVGQEPRENDPE